MIDAHNIRKASWTIGLVFIFFMVFGPSNLEYFWHVYLVIALFAVVWTLYLIYVCEKFTLYMSSFLVAFMGAFSVLPCSVAYIIAAKSWGEHSLFSLATGLAPLGITLFTYWVLVNGKPTFHPFEYDGLKVQPRYQKKQNPTTSYNPVLVAGATTLAASVSIKALGLPTAGMIAMVGLQAFCVAALFHARHVIRGLRVLRIQQKSMSTPYTFMQIDGLREARSRWWVSRLIRWVAALMR
jgi:hypothetical protein